MYIKKPNPISLNYNNLKNLSAKNNLKINIFYDKLYKIEHLKLPKINKISHNLSDIIKPKEETKNSIIPNLPNEKNKNYFLTPTKSLHKSSSILDENSTEIRNSKKSLSIRIENTPTKFHTKLMNKNILSFNESRKDDYLEQIKNEKIKNEMMIYKRKQSDNIEINNPLYNKFNIISDNERFIRFDKDYKKASNNVKDLIKDEILSAHLKLKIKPEQSVIEKLNKIKPRYLRKFDEIKFIAGKNKILEINPNAKTPSLIDDGAALHYFLDDEYKKILINQNKNIKISK